MAVKNAGNRDITKTPQYIESLSFDPEFETKVTQNLGYDGVNLQRGNADNLAIKVTTSGTVTYMAFAAPGTAEATAKWQAKKIDSTTGVVITYADGDANFDNVATDLTALTYS